MADFGSVIDFTKGVNLDEEAAAMLSAAQLRTLKVIMTVTSARRCSVPMQRADLGRNKKTEKT